MKNSRFTGKIYLASIFLAITFTFAANVKAVCTTGTNLILNGDAEADQALGGSGADHDLSNWEPETGTFTAVRYTTGTGFPTNADPGPLNRGNFFFAGGPANGTTSGGTQIVNVADCAATIDAGQQTYDVSGFFGGFSTQADSAALGITFKNSANTTIGTTAIGSVTPADRGNVTGLLMRAASGTVPVGTRTIEVVLSMPPTGGYNDGYADNLSFVLNSTTAANTSISGQIITAGGRGIRNASVSLTKPNGEIINTVTGSFGYYLFDNLPIGQTYIVTVRANRFTFANPTQIVNLNNEITNLHFVADSN